MMSGSDGHHGSDDEGEDERDRRATNIFLLIATIFFIGAGIWLVDALLAARKADECISAGRRCAPVQPIQR